MAGGKCANEWCPNTERKDGMQILVKGGRVSVRVPGRDLRTIVNATQLVKFAGRIAVENGAIAETEYDDCVETLGKLAEFLKPGVNDDDATPEVAGSGTTKGHRG